MNPLDTRLSSLVPLSGSDRTRAGNIITVAVSAGTQESSLAYPGSHSSSENVLAFLTPAFPTAHTFPAPGLSSLGALVSSLE